MAPAAHLRTTRLPPAVTHAHAAAELVIHDMLEVLCSEIVGVVAEGIHRSNISADDGRGFGTLSLICIASEYLLIIIKIYCRWIIGTIGLARVQFVCFVITLGLIRRIQRPPIICDHNRLRLIVFPRLLL